MLQHPAAHQFQALGGYDAGMYNHIQTHFPLCYCRVPHSLPNCHPVLHKDFADLLNSSQTPCSLLTCLF